VTLLEASAGTGKTFTIAGLVTRYVAEGTPLERILVITFTRMATGELRERVRERLVSGAGALAGVLAGVEVDEGDEVLATLARGGPEVVAARYDRLAKAVADFDDATIETTHGFCLHVLVGLGVAGDVERDVTFVEDVSDLLAEVVEDLYVRRFWSSEDPPPFGRDQALEVGQAALGNPAAVIVPPMSAHRGVPSMRGRLARRILEEIDERKRIRRVITYDDLLQRLDHTLGDPERGPAVVRWLRSRYDIALVDEFQDTDLVQWNIMRRAFGSGDSTLVLIGDPKQAIYAFRGADVYSYLRAAAQASTQATLGTNWRSDQGLLDAYDALFKGSQLGHAGIGYRTVVAAPENRVARLAGAPGGPLRVRIVDRTGVALSAKGYAQLNPTRALVAKDLAADVVRLLDSGAAITDGGETEAVRPGHLAVLVRTNRQATWVRDALHECGVPAVTSGSGSVFSTEAGSDWLALLEALNRPTDRARAAAAALSSFIGWQAVAVATSGDEAWEDLHWRLHQWSAILRRRGVAALFEHVSATEHLGERVLKVTNGERLLTDLHHIGQLLHAAARTEDLGPAAVTAWLRRRREDDAADADDEDRSRRLDSDAEAVQVLTIHRSKGLEFPIVYCPYLWDVYDATPKVPVFHDPDNDDARTINVGGPEDRDFTRHCGIDQHEERGEDARLLYVALTRARHQAVLWWAGTWAGRHSPLSRLLFDRDEHGVVAAEGSPPPTDEVVKDRFEELAARSGGQISVEWARPGPGGAWAGPPQGVRDLGVALFDRTLDLAWRRSSYSGIVEGVYESHVGSEPEADTLVDEFAGRRTPGGALREAGAKLLTADLPAGTQIGTLVHRVLERSDFAAEDLVGELRAAIEAELAWSPVDLGDPERWVEGLAAMIATPLGPLASDVALRSIGRADRLDELDFELPLVGGDAPSGALRVADLAAVLAEHVGPGDPLAGYADALGDPALDRTLRGYLTGSLDLVLRLPGERFAVADYKTNRLGPTSGATAWDYRRSALDVEMHHAHYPLQALLYSVALHRYLRWRLPAYDPAVQFAGVLYLFTRGMSSPAFPCYEGEPCGAWSWRPTVALLEALSDLFDTGRGP